MNNITNVINERARHEMDFRVAVVRLVMFGFIGFALSRHTNVIDAVAITLAFILIVRAISPK